MIVGALIVVSFVVVIALIMYFSINFKTKSEQDEENKLRRSLEEDYIFDPITNSKISLEEAESGEWEVNEDQFWERPDEDIRKFAFEEQKIQERALNALRSSKRFLKSDPFDDDQIDILLLTKMLSQFEDWSYSNVFHFNEGYLFTPYIENEYKLMMWIKIYDCGGQYYFREKTKTEALFDKIRNDDEIKVENYECYTIKPSSQVSQVVLFLKKFSRFKGLEIELFNSNMFIRTHGMINKEDVVVFEKILSILYRDIKPFY